LIGRDLRKKVVDVRVVTLRSRQDDRLGQRRDPATHAIELPTVRVRTSQDFEKYGFDLRSIGRQVLGIEEHALRASPTIKSRRYPALCHPFSPWIAPPTS